MRLAEFLVSILQAHAQTLQRLAALFGEEELIEIIENAGDLFPSELKPEWVESLDPPASGAPSASSAYSELEGSVQELNLSPILEFYLWAYPTYRSFIESELDLNARIRGSGTPIGVDMVDTAVEQAEHWIRHLRLPAAQSQLATRAAHVPWLRFRTEVLKRIGRRPLGPVY